MNGLTKEQIVALALCPAYRTRVEVPEWGDAVWLRLMDESEVGAMAEMFKAADLTQDQRAKLLTKCLCDESGERTFTDDDWPVLAKHPFKVLDRLATAALAFNGITTDAQESIAKNSETTT